MKRSDINEAPEYFEYFIKLVDDIELAEAFDKSLKQIDDLNIVQLKRIGQKVYADGKWSINKIIQHLTDWERIWCYRTLIFARKEGTIPEGHDRQIILMLMNYL